MALAAIKNALALGGAVIAIAIAAPAWADDASTDAETASAKAKADQADIVVTAKATRSATAISGAEIQKLLAGASPFKSIQTLPGVMYVTADPWGNNEQNASLFIHGFSAGQLGHTMDGIPLGDQNYGNYNGLSPQRAIISENVGRVVVATGAAELGLASTSNLGGGVETFSAEPDTAMSLRVNQTMGSYGTSRTYVRVDSGTFGNGNSLYASVLRQRARAWDFEGRQGGWQANAKLVHDDSNGKFTAYIAYSDKIEPNEDSTTIYKVPGTAAQAYQPATRPFTYPNFATAVAYLDANGAVPALEAVNYRNYYSDAQRTDYLGYVKYAAHLSSTFDWSTQAYFHHNDGVGVVAGPITVASLPTLFALYFPGQNLKIATGNSGYAVRTTEYRIDRGGVISNMNIDLGTHKIEAGMWLEYNSSSAYRRWYALDVNHPENYSPYIRPSNPMFTQYASEIRNTVAQFHLQDDWQLTPRLLVQAGFKSSLQFARGDMVVQPIIGSLPGSSSALPSGEINTKRWFLPAIGAKWDVTDNEQIYFNAQQNLRQLMTYGAGGTAPWSVGSQAAFDNIKNNVKPETARTYEIGLRSHHSFNSGLLSAIEAQINVYHVDFHDRLLSLTAAVGGIAGGSISGGTPTLVSVGDVKTDGIDTAVTLHFGEHFSLYNALSYNRTKYDSDYSSITGTATGTQIGGFATVSGVVPTGGKNIPISPSWLNKTIATATFGRFEAQAVGDYVGKRYATFTNDAWVDSTFQASLRLAYRLPIEGLGLRKADISVNVTNLFDTTGVATLSAGSNTNTYNIYPLAPRQWFATLSAQF
ncbi:MAG: hypothetical protein RLZZ136_844 [Pseudomonadota bacterium]|jgi:hypothetical protein